MKPIIYDELKVGDKVITRDLREGRIICLDLKGEEPIAIALKEGVREAVRLYYKDGRYQKAAETNLDIFLAPKKEYVNFYKSKDIGFYCGECSYPSLEDAAAGADFKADFIKTIEVEV